MGTVHLEPTNKNLRIAIISLTPTISHNRNKAVTNIGTIINKIEYRSENDTKFKLYD